jgi:Flavoprotein
MHLVRQAVGLDCGMIGHRWVRVHQNAQLTRRLAARDLTRARDRHKTRIDRSRLLAGYRRMNLDGTDANERFSVAYLVLSGTTTAARCPELLRGLVGLGFSTVLAIPTPNASRVVAPRDLADVKGAQVVQSYFDLAIRPRPPRGVVLFAPCSFNSLNRLAHGIADNLALSVVAEAIGRGTPVVVGPSLNAPLLNHPVAQESLRKLSGWGLTIVPPVDEGEGPRLAPSGLLFDAVRPYVAQPGPPADQIPGK